MEKSVLCQSRGNRKLPPPPKVAPWLVFPHGKDRKFHSFYNICDDADDKLKKRSLNKFIPELSLKSFQQKTCHQGWVIVISDDTSDPNYGDCFLWNPQTLDTIQLPSVVEYYETEGMYELTDCILTSPPQINTSISSNSSSDTSSSSDDDNSDRDSMVYFLFDGGNNGIRYTLLFCHPGEKEWRRHGLNITHSPRSMLYLKNKLHVMCTGNLYYEIEVQGGSDIDDDKTLAVGDAIFISRDSIALIESTGGMMLCSFMEYYVESFGEVFRIHTWFIRRGIYSNGMRKIEILKLNFASMAWETVTSLGDRVFFISYDTQLCCLASDLGFPKGCMYYTQGEEMSLYKYDLEDQSILFSVPCPDLPTPWFHPEWLMITTTLRLDDKRQTTDCSSLKVTETVAHVDEKEDIEEARLGILASDDFVWSVSKQLHTLDYIHLRAVSKRYRAILNLKRSSSDRTIQTINLAPWLVFSNCDRSTFSFVNPSHNNEKYLLNITEMVKGFRICFSKGGWLLMSKHPQLFFHNPFTRSSIKLPDFTDEIISRFSGISFSCLPTSSDCTVFAFGKQMNGNVSIFYIKRGEQCWRHGSFADTYLASNGKLMKFHTGLNNPVFYEGAFYCLALDGTLGVSKYENGVISWDVLSMVPQPNCEFIYESYLVECEGKLMCVLLGHMGKWIRIFALNNSKTVWVEVENLGPHMLCISNTSCISSVAPTSQMENKIFFSRLHEEGIIFYSLDTGMYHCLGSRHSAKDYRDSREMLCCSWIEPDWSQISDRFSDWLSF